MASISPSSTRTHVSWPLFHLALRITHEEPHHAQSTPTTGHHEPHTRHHGAWPEAMPHSTLPQKDGGSATLEASARPTNARNYRTRHCVTKPAPRQQGLTHQEIRVGLRGTVEALDASPISPTCPDNTKPKHQPAPGCVRPGFGMEDDSIELPTTP
ncbi:hypothetical protein TanjilG_21877 [Lupinus angustifolius]|nr:hypothetical protein TanjilG_21877 [Lupinus angustifolius]